MFDSQVGKFVLVSLKQFAEPCVLQRMTEMMQNGSLSLRLFIRAMLVGHIAQQLCFLLLAREPRLCFAVCTNSGFHVTHVQRIFFEDELTNEVLNIFLRFESNRLWERLLKLLWVEP